MPDSEPRKPYAIIPRKHALALIPICLGGAVFLQWLAASGQWWDMFLIWPPLIMAGAFITRCWPLFLLGDD